MIARNMRTSLFFLCKVLLVVWASPNSAIGLLAGLLGLCSGGHVQVRRGAIEFWGGAVSAVLRKWPIPIAAMTLGHIIVGTDPVSLERVRDHEHIHVKQYERWGIFFLPVYFFCSFVLYLRGKNPYLDNPFEVEAFSRAP